MGEIWKSWVGNESECRGWVCGVRGSVKTLCQVGWYSLVGGRTDSTD